MQLAIKSPQSMGAASDLSDKTPCAHTGKERYGFTKAYEHTQGSYRNLRAHRIKRINQIVTPGSCNSLEVCSINSENGMNHQSHKVGLRPHHSKCGAWILLSPHSCTAAIHGLPPHFSSPANDPCLTNTLLLF